MSRYHGKAGQVRINGTLVAMATWSLDKGTARTDVTSFGDPNLVSVQGLPAIKGNFSGFWDNADTAMLAAAEAAAGCTLGLYPSSLVPTACHYGPAWLDYKMDVDVKGAVKISGSFEANGAWGHTGL